ncbi:MAG: prephenate dehydratase [Nitrospinae bacterium]|nr:prephenate dehydratase [Nitrospinota bacterium]
MQKIVHLREQIDKIDDQFLKLLTRRAELAIQIGKEKSKENSSNHFHVPHREREIIERLQSSNPGTFPNAALDAVFREIFSATLALEKPLTIAYFGPESTFTHQAALKRFGHSAIYKPAHNIDGVFEEVEKGAADYGVVPIENSIEGVVNLTLDVFFDSPLIIIDEIKLGISLYLMSRTGDLKTVQTIYSHPQPFAQSRNWLNRNCPGIEQVPVSSTALAARMSAKDERSAAIASLLAAEFYQLKVVAEKIEDQKENHTRFLVIGKEKAKKARRNKTSILFSIKDEAGSLFKVLQLFARNKINLTKIQSRPLRNRPWEYLFYLDFDGHEEDKSIAKTLGQLARRSLFLKVLGSYPRKP